MTVQYTPQENCCPNCGVQVYQAEALLAGNYRWHKRCFKCCWCNKFLNTSNCNVHEGFLFCKHCLEEVTRNQKPQIYPDTTVIKPDEAYGAPKECPRCGGAVFDAEKIVEKGLTYHKRCFTCVKCNRPQEDRLQVHIGFDDQIYCKVCYPAIHHTPLAVDPNETMKIPAAPGDLSGCPRCGGKVFEAEKMALGGLLFHQKCFTCRACFKPLDHYNCFSHSNEIFCKTCFVNFFDTRSKSVGPANTSAIKGNFQRRDACPRCGGIVFEAEKIGTRHYDYHRQCLSCFSCGHKLDATNFSDAPDGEVYCNTCYTWTFGHRSRAKSIGAVDTSKIAAPLGDISRCPHCGGRVFEAEKLVSRSGWYHKSCFKCCNCNHMLDQTNFNDGPDGNIYCRSCYKILGVMDLNQTARSLIDTTSIRPAHEDQGACPRCGGKVFEAEKRVARSGVYHKRCFTCQVCKRALDGLLAADAPNRFLLCEPCYKKSYGPAELRILTQDQSQKSLDTKVIKPVNREAGCVRCGGAVFEAEKIISKGLPFHKACTSCKSCGKRLDAASLCSGFAKDPEIYCKGCYGRQHGSAGYRGILGSQWIDEKSSQLYRPTQYINTAALKAGQGDLACRRCQGKVYELERIASKSFVWHKQCFTCKGCKVSLNSPTITAYEGQDENVYCQTCFKRNFGDDGTKPMTFTNTKAIKPCSGEHGCPRCGGVVFEAEKIIAAENVWFHKSCFDCKVCHTKLDSVRCLIATNSEAYCQTCYKNTFGASGRNFYGWRGRAVTPARGTRTNDNGCVGCGGQVYEMDKIIAKCGLFHKECLRCATSNCRRLLDATNFYDGPNNVYCQKCYTEQFGVRGRAKSVDGRIHTDRVRANPNDQSGCPRCFGKVYEAEKMQTSVGAFHPRCFKCAKCNGNLDQSSCYCGFDGEIYCQLCYKEEFGILSRRGRSRSRPVSRAGSRPPSRACLTSESFDQGDEMMAEDALARAVVDTTAIMAHPNDRYACPKCRGKVFEAEKMASNNGFYFHKKCFHCCDCKRALDPSLVCDGPVFGQIFCKNCYKKYYGPTSKVFDESIAMKSLDLSRAKAVHPDKACPRCGGGVFATEELLANGRAYHKRCAKCKACNRQLEASSLFGGSDKEIYCQGCYSRKFGTAGYRGIQSTNWSDEMSTLQNRPHVPTVANTAGLFAAHNDPNACIRCHGKVFDAEKVFAAKGVFHRACFKCVDCLISLDSTRVCDAPNGEIYCKNCYQKFFGLHGFGYGGFGSVPALTAGGNEAKMDYHFTQFF